MTKVDCFILSEITKKGGKKLVDMKDFCPPSRHTPTLTLHRTDSPCSARACSKYLSGTCGIIPGFTRTNVPNIITVSVVFQIHSGYCELRKYLSWWYQVCLGVSHNVDLLVFVLKWTSRFPLSVLLCKKSKREKKEEVFEVLVLPSIFGSMAFFSCQPQQACKKTHCPLPQHAPPCLVAMQTWLQTTLTCSCLAAQLLSCFCFYGHVRQDAQHTPPGHFIGYTCWIVCLLS